MRQERQVRLFCVNELDLAPRPAPVHDRIPLSTAAGDEGFLLIAAYRSVGAPVPLPYQLSARKLEPSLATDVLLQISPGRLETHALLVLKPAPGSDLLQASIPLPPDSRVVRVDSDRLQDWWTEGGKLAIRFSGDTPPATTLLVGLARDWPAVPKDFAFSPLVPEGFTKVKGRGAVAAWPDLGVQLAFDQRKVFVREIATEEALAEYPALGAFSVAPPLETKRHFTYDVGNFTITATTEPVLPRYDVRWVMAAEVHETWSRTEAFCDAEVKSGAIHQLEYSLSAGLPQARVTGADVRQVVRNSPANEPTRYTVHFQRPVVDAVRFTVQMDLPHSGAIRMPVVEFPKPILPSVSSPSKMPPMANCTLTPPNPPWWSPCWRGKWKRTCTSKWPISPPPPTTGPPQAGIWLYVWKNWPPAAAPRPWCSSRIC